MATGQQFMVPQSKHCIFIRGFSTRLLIDNIRNFFETDVGERPNIEFLRESEDKKNYYLALRFENKAIAKEVIDKYHQKEVLGSYVKITYFRDMKRARQKAQDLYERGDGPDPREMFPTGYVGNNPKMKQHRLLNSRPRSSGISYDDRGRPYHDKYSRKERFSHSRSRSFSRSPISHQRSTSFSKSPSDGNIKSVSKVPSNSKPSDRKKSQYYYEDGEDGEYLSASENRRRSFDDDLGGYTSDISRRKLTSNQGKPNYDDDKSTLANGSVKKRKSELSVCDEDVYNLPPEKLKRIQERKDEIEKSFKQDCETFAAVVKMLISKDSSLEAKLQISLKENLKDIGHRCIQELKEFIESVKNE